MIKEIEPKSPQQQPILSKNAVIGIFDSGLGGLTVVRALLQQKSLLPLIYFGDTARFPYGNKGPETIQRYSLEICSFLISQGATHIIVACNTATSTALSYLTSKLTIPIFGVIESAARKAVQQSVRKKIGVIGTTATIRSGSYEKAIHQLNPSIEVVSKACPLLVTLIEEGSPSEAVTDAIINDYIQPLIRADIDTLLLGCTHYPLLKDRIARACGPSISLIDPAESLTASLHIGKTEQYDKAPQLRIFSSDSPDQFKLAGERFLGIPLPGVQSALL